MKICNFRLYSESEASRTLWGKRSDLFSAQKNIVRFGWYRVTRSSPKLVLAAITRNNFRPKKPCNFKLDLWIGALYQKLRGVQHFTLALHDQVGTSGDWFLSCFLGD